MSTLEGACAAGSCDSLQRDDVTNAADALLSLIASDFPTVDVSAAMADSATLAAASDIPSIESGLIALSDSVSALAEPVCKIASYRPALKWQPVFDASLIGEPITYSVELQNLGTVTATYDVTITLPQGETVLNETVAPRSSNTLSVNPATTAQGLFILSAVATATNPEVAGDNFERFSKSTAKRR